MTRRKLTPEEIDLWHTVVGTVERMQPGGEARPRPKPKPVKPLHPRIEPFRAGQAALTPPPRHDLKPPLPDRLARAPLAIGRKTHARMKRGKLEPEARVDLHGQRLEAAHVALTRFILTSQAAGRRLVLVITGKGRAAPDDAGPIPSPRGLLRHQVPEWLALPPLAQAVLQVEQAHVSHGGGGAYYVYLRKGR